MKKKRKIKLDYKDLETIRDFGSAMIADSVKINMEKTSNNLSSQPINYTGPEIKSLLPQFGPVVGKIITAEVTTNDPDSDGLSWDDYYDLIGQETLPIISIITGEGGSGGAVALATGNRVSMFEHSIYSVISPEGC